MSNPARSKRGEGLTKLACLAVQAAVRTMQLTLARDANNVAQASDVFDPEEIEVLQLILPTLEGKTEKQKNPHRHGSLAQAARIVTRLGGWKGYASEAKPGPHGTRLRLRNHKKRWAEHTR